MIHLLNLIIGISFAYYTCEINTASTGKIKYKAETMEKAMHKTTVDCMNVFTSQYRQKNGRKTPKDRQILFLEYCVNNNFCKNNTKVIENSTDK